MEIFTASPPPPRKREKWLPPTFTMVDLGAAKTNETLVLNLFLSSLSILDEVI